MEKNNIAEQNANTISKELDWLSEMISFRINNYFNAENKIKAEINPPNIESDNSKYARFLNENKINDFERLLIASGLALYFKPEIFDAFLIKNKNINKVFTEFGGKIKDNNSIFIPTLGTIAFLCFGSELEPRFSIQNLFKRDHLLNKENIIILEDNNSSILLNKTIKIGEEFLELITLGKEFKPSYSSHFPADLLTTNLNWDDLVLDDNILIEVENINTWLNHEDEINNDVVLSKKISRGYKSLFYGPPGTGKTLTVSLLGKKNNRDVYRIDLSSLVSKYIGETEKNLGRIFDIAENKNWILFFDEAESLFSKRTGVSDSKDKFANQQTAYLLQRLESYKGLIVLATNLKPNIDQAFSRRIHSSIYFAMPNINERIKLWTNALKEISELSPEFIEKISNDFELSGGSIINIIQFAWLLSKKNKTNIRKKDILIGIKRELTKDGKSI